MTREEAKAFLQSRIDLIDKYYPNEVEDYREALETAIKALEQETVTEFADRCRECGREKVLDKIVAEISELIESHDVPIEIDGGDDAWFCEGCNRAIEIIDKYRETQETETWNGIHAQITAPKGTFEKIWNDTDGDNDI